MKITRLMAFCALISVAQADEPFGIHVIDEATGRGVPLATLTTVNDISLVTDSAGWAAFDEPGLMNARVYFHVDGPGYEMTKDGFGFAGAALQTAAGQSARIKVRRLFPAERLCRLSGQGLYRDTQLLGRSAPHPRPVLDGDVLGLDSVQVTPFQGRHLWIWGDTNLPGYPLGQFHATGAFSDPPSRGGLHPAHGVAYDYIMNDSGRVKKMAPMDKEGPVWLFGLLTIADDKNQERVISHYTRQKSLGEVLEHGLMEFDPAPQLFVKIRELPMDLAWQFPRAHALRVTTETEDHFYFCDPFPTTRVAAKLDAILDPQAFEALSYEPSTKSWTWQKAQPPITQEIESAMVKDGKLAPAETRFQLKDSDGRAILAHGGTLQWNPHRQRWVMVFVEMRGQASHLGEVWYAESRDLTGPWGAAVQIASHPNQTFYNPAHHPHFDQQDGRLIHFEGTYTRTFSGNPTATPRYDYNQLFYRLDLDDPRLAPARTP